MENKNLKTNKLPASFGINIDLKNPLWGKYISWLNKKREYEHKGNLAGTDWNYYGVNGSGYVDFSDGTRCFMDTVLTLEEWDGIVNGNQNKVEITRKQLKEIHDVACTTWQEKIKTRYATRNPWGETIWFIQDEIDEMFKAARNNQITVLENIFGKQTKEIDLSTGKVDKLELFNPHPYSNTSLIVVRNGLEYGYKAFLLNDKYNWEIITDSAGCKCLVPTRKYLSEE